MKGAIPGWLRTCTAVVAAAMLTLAFSSVSSAAPGDLDASFGSGGLVAIGQDMGADQAAVLLADGKLVVAGIERGTSYDRLLVVRLTNDGQIDPVLGRSVASYLPFQASDIADFEVQDDGRLLLLYRSAGVMYLARLKADLSPDPSFGVQGSVSLIPPGGNRFRGISVFPRADGTYLVAGDTSASLGAPEYVTLAHVGSGGALDTAFGTAGFSNTGVPGAATDAVQTADGKIVVAGLTRTVVRINGDGSLDSGFGNGGVMVNPLLTYFGNFVAVGLRQDGGLVIIDSAGNLDSQGVFADQSGGSQFVTQPTTLEKYSAFPGDWSRTFIAGHQTEPPGLAVERFTDTGEIDRTFGIAGRSIPVYAYGATFSSALSDAAGRIYVLGKSKRKHWRTTSIVRLLGGSSGRPAPYRTISYPANKQRLNGGGVRFEGLSSPSNAIVQLALRRVERRNRGCLWWENRAKKFKRRRSAGARGCASPRYFAIGDGPSWSYALHRRLPAGRYQIFVRAKLAAIDTYTPFTTDLDGYRTFTVRRAK